MKNEVTKQIRVYGIVQGVGFRPTVSRHAATHQIRGSVSNKGPYVEIFAQGPEEAVDRFISDIENKPPKRAAILKMNIEPIKKQKTLRSLRSLKVKRRKVRFLSHRILQFVMNARKKCLIRRTVDICIHLSTVPAVDQDLRSWMPFRMTGSAPA